MNYITKKKLYNLCIEQGLSVKEIAKIFGCGCGKIYSFLREYKIKPKGGKFRITKDELYDLYIKKQLSMIEISKKFNVSESSVYRKIKSFELFGIKKRGNKPKINISKNELYDLYITQSLSSTQIGEKLECSSNCILDRLKYFGIPIRSRGGMKGRQNCFYGKHHTQETKDKISRTKRGIK